MNDVLIISYNFPPYWSPGTVRVAKLARFSEFGWHPIVITCRRRYFPPEIRVGMSDFEKARIIRLPINVLDWLEGFKQTLKPLIKPFLHSIRTKQKQQLAGSASSAMPDHQTIYHHGWPARLSRFFLPVDTYILWCPLAFISACWVLLRNPQIRLLLVSGPPFSQQWVGALLKRLFPRLQFVADFRDTWVEDINRYYPTAIHRHLEHAAEQFVADQADAITVVADDFVPLFEKKYHPKERPRLIHNGYDANDFDQAAKSARSSVFNIHYVGGIGEGRNISGLIRAVDQLLKSGRLQKESIRFNFWGFVHPFFKNEVERFGLQEVFRFYPRIPYREALERMREATVLLLVFENDPCGGFYSTKFFEYLYVRRPILVIGPARGAGKFIQENRIGQCVMEDDIEGISRTLMDFYTRYSAGTLTDHSADIEAFSRRHIAMQMASLFDSLSGQSTTLPKELAHV